MIKINSTILEKISSEQALYDAWKLLNKSNKSSKGLSNISVKDFEGNLKKNISDISKALITETYQFSKVKGVAIKKKDGKPRPLRIPEIKDRLVHKVLAIEFEKILSPIFKLDNVCSFAYQTGKGIMQAIVEMNIYYREGYRIILETDIVKFFPSVDSKSLIKKIQDTLPDKSVHILFEKAMNQEIGNVSELQNRKLYEEHFQDNELGIPQGNALSPLLANICLAEFDQRMINENFKMIRYADDFIVLCKDKIEANRAFEIAKDELEEKLKLNLYEIKPEPVNGEKISRILDPRATVFSFLSVRFDGKRCWVMDSKVDSLVLKLKNITSLEERKINGQEEIWLLQSLIKIKNLLEGWIAAYFFLDIERQIIEIDKHVNVELYQLFQSFNFNLQKKDLQKISFKNRSNTRLGLGDVQRKFSGISSCISTLKKTRIKRDVLEELIKTRLDIINLGLNYV